MKRKYKVNVFREFWNEYGRQSRIKLGTFETWAVSKAKAENNVRFRTIGKNYSFAEAPGDSLVELVYEAEEA